MKSFTICIKSFENIDKAYIKRGDQRRQGRVRRKTNATDPEGRKVYAESLCVLCVRRVCSSSSSRYYARNRAADQTAYGDT